MLASITKINLLSCILGSYRAVRYFSKVLRESAYWLVSERRRMDFDGFTD